MTSGHGPDGHGHGPSDAHGIGFDLGEIGFHGFSGGTGHHGGSVSMQALIVSHVFEHGGHICGPATFSFDGGCHFHAHVDATLGGCADFNGAPKGQRTFTFVVRNHGVVDLISAISKETAKLALVERSGGQDATANLIRRYDYIAPIMIAGGETRLPESSYKGATGLTVYLRKPFTLGNRSWLDKKLGVAAKLDSHAPSTRVIVSVVQWYFAEVGDYQSLVTVTVETPKTPFIAGAYRQPPELGAHINAARELSTSLLKALQACPPSPSAREKRAKKTNA